MADQWVSEESEMRPRWGREGEGSVVMDFSSLRRRLVHGGVGVRV